jgi:DNA-binding IclR family transcriptional regulator
MVEEIKHIYLSSSLKSADLEAKSGYTKTMLTGDLNVLTNMNIIYYNAKTRKYALLPESAKLIDKIKSQMNP